MTVLADPVEQFWAPAQAQTLALTDSERTQAEDLERQSHLAKDLFAIGLVLGGAFLLYRAYAERQMRKRLPTKPDAMTMRTLSLLSWRGFQPMWLRITGPAIATAYAKGMLDARLGSVPPEVLQVLAEKYAMDMGVYFNETSAQALSEGFTAYVNRKIPPRVAADKAIAAFGLDAKQMRALVAAENLGAMKVTSIIEQKINAKTDRYIETQMIARAQRVSDNEAFTAMRRGKQLTWMYLIRTGKLPADTEKVWITAHDERVCQYCGPMHHAEALVTEPFDTPQGKAWVPALHPNCRCNIELKVDARELFGKADWWSNEWEEAEHPRDDEGRFTFKPKLLTLRAKEETERKTPVIIGEEQALIGGPAPLIGGAGPVVTGAPFMIGESAPAPFMIGAEPVVSEAPVIGAEPLIGAEPVITEPVLGTGQLGIQDQFTEMAERMAQETQAIERTLAGVRALAEARVRTGTAVSLGNEVWAAPSYAGEFGEQRGAIDLGTQVQFGDVNAYPIDTTKKWDAVSSAYQVMREGLINDVLSAQRGAGTRTGDQPPPVTPRTTVGIFGGAGEESASEQGIQAGGRAYTRGEVTAIIDAELLGESNDPARQIARDQFGVRREDVAIPVFATSEGIAGDPMRPESTTRSRQDEDGNWILPGEYRVVGEREIEPTGIPMKIWEVTPVVEYPDVPD